MFDPIIFPKTRPVTLLLIAEIEVNNSGADVAIDTTVNPQESAECLDWLQDPSMNPIVNLLF